MTVRLIVAVLVSALFALVWYGPTPMPVKAAEWFTNAAPYNMGTPLWRDQLVPVAQLGQGADPCTIGAFGPSGNVRQYRCAVNKGLDGAMQFNHDMKMNTPIYCHVHWAPIDTDVGYVRWMLEYYWLDIGAATGVAAPTAIYAEQVSDGTAWKHQIVPFTTIAASATANQIVSSMLMFKISRVAATAGGPDEYANSAVPLAMDCHYQVDSLGSRQEISK